MDKDPEYAPEEGGRAVEVAAGEVVAVGEEGYVSPGSREPPAPPPPRPTNAQSAPMPAHKMGLTSMSTVDTMHPVVDPDEDIESSPELEGGRSKEKSLPCVSWRA